MLTIRTVITGTRVTRAALAALPFLLMASLGITQTRMFAIDPPPGSSEFGLSVAWLGDTNADGFSDFVVGAPATAGGFGSVYVISGRNGTVLHSLRSPIPGTGFGFSLANVGDLDKDGVNEFLIGAYAPGYALLCSGKSGGVISSILGPVPHCRFGWSVAGIGDVNKDGSDDFVVGAPTVPPSITGAVYVYSGKTRALLTSINGLVSGSHFGWSVTGLGDVNNDTYPDFAVGAPSSEGATPTKGYVHVFSGSSMTTLYTLTSESVGQFLGYSVAGLGDADGDGAPDLAAGAPAFANNRGHVLVVSGRTGALIRELIGPIPYAGFGYAVAPAGDLDTDKTNDLLVGSPGDSQGSTPTGSIQAYSLKGTGRRLWIVYGQIGQVIGVSADGGADSNRDGVPDVLAGSYWASATKEVLVLSGKSIAVVGVPSRGKATITSTPWEIGKNFKVSGGGVRPNSFGPLLISFSPRLPIAVEPDFVVHLDLAALVGYAIVSSNTQGDWSFSYPFPLPNEPILTGLDFSTQVAFPANNPLKHELTAGLHAQITAPPDTAPPAIASGITTPLWTNKTSLHLPVTISDALPTFTEVLVNGIPALATDRKSINATVSLAEGDNRIEIRSRDAANNVAAPLVLTGITRDTKNPRLFDLQPRSGETVPTKTFTVSGRAAEPLKSITLNSKAVPLGKDGRSFQGVFSVTKTGKTTLAWTATDLASNSVTTSILVVVEDAPLKPTIVSVPIRSGAVGAGYRYQVVASHPKPAEPLTFSLPTKPAGAAIHAGTGLITWKPTKASVSTLVVRVTDSTSQWDSQTFLVHVIVLPPDPKSNASPLSRTSATPVSEGTKFLYEGSNAPQTEVGKDKIEAQRAGVVWGKVVDASGAPLPGVTIRVLGDAAYGKTLSRADGQFELAVNGGNSLNLVFEKAGYIPAQRLARVPWLDYTSVRDVAMIPYDPKVTQVDLGSLTTIKVVRGSATTDQDGTRKPTLLFKPGTSALLRIGQDALPLATLQVRTTEFTVGSQGLARMPAELPPYSAYTYAVEFTATAPSVDAGGLVSFSQDVPFYVDNFLNFPVGGAVPAGYLDRQKGVWAPAKDGRVVKILAINPSGLAEIDIEGKGKPATATELATLGIDEAERRRVAELYPIGKTLWRTPIPHFSTWDCNWGFGYPDDATPPSPGGGGGGNGGGGGCFRSRGSIILNERQAMIERIPVVGTPYYLNYASDTVSGFKAARTISIPLTEDTYPKSLKAIALIISVAGKRTSLQFKPGKNLEHTFVWDGQDRFGRPVLGAAVAKIEIGYVYDGVYQRPTGTGRSFMALSGVRITGSQTRREIAIWRDYERALTNGHDASLGLGGWTLNSHHAYYPAGGLRLGDGSARVARNQNDLVVRHFASPYIPGLTWSGMWIGPDGDVYYSDHGTTRYAPDGTVRSTIGPKGSSGAFGPDGYLYITTSKFFNPAQAYSIIKFDSATATYTTIAGTGVYGHSGDGGPAATATLGNAFGINVLPDGSIVFAEEYNNHHRIRRITPDGVIDTLAGKNRLQYSGDGGPARNASFVRINDLAVNSSGSIFVAHSYPNCIREIGPDGIIRRIAGNGAPGNFIEGAQALSTPVSPTRLAISRGSDLIWAEGGWVRWLHSDGTATTFAGGDKIDYGRNGWPARAAWFKPINHLATSPDGRIFVSHAVSNNSARIRVIAPPMPGFGLDDIAIASADGNRMFRFDKFGRHRETRSTNTGQALYTFNYVKDRLAEIVDRDGNATRILRDASGNPTEVIGPFGQKTKLTTDSNGYLATIENPAGERHILKCSAAGLLLTISDPMGNQHRYVYDESGYLVRDDDPALGSQVLTGKRDRNGFLVTRTSALGRKFSYQLETTKTRELDRTVTSPDGTALLWKWKPDATHETTYPSGVVIRSKQGPDPRFSMNAPLWSSYATTVPSSPTSIVVTASASRSHTLLGADPLDLATKTESTTMNGKVFTRFLDRSGAIPKLTTTSRAGRTRTVEFDQKERPIRWLSPKLEPIAASYDARGRLTTIQTGTVTSLRLTRYAYDASGHLATIQDNTARKWTFNYDAAGRVTTLTLPSGFKVLYRHDRNGNVTSITPPGRPAHGFRYTALNQIEEYIPPSLGTGNWSTTYKYDLDRQLQEITRADGKKAVFNYDGVTGQLTSRVLPNGTTSYMYDPKSGLLSTITNPIGTVSFAYAGAMLVRTTWAGQVNGNVTQALDGNLRVASRSINGGHTIAFAYDPDGLVTTVGPMALFHDPQNGQLTSTRIGAVADAVTYDGFGKVTGYSATHNGNPLYAYTLTRDALGRITGRSETVLGGTTTYAYRHDLDGQLVSVNRGGTSIAYAYDANGNRTTLTVGTSTTTATYDAQDRLVTYGTKSFTCSRAGELLTMTDGGQVTSFNYCILGNLLGVSIPSASSTVRIEYLLDGRGRRIGKKVDGKLVRSWLYKDSLNPVAELDGNGVVVSRFVYATHKHVPDFMIKGSSTYRIISDHVGSVRLVVRLSDASIAQRLDYDEFGVVTNDTAPGFQPFAFAGGMYDSHTGLVRFGARDYLAVVGRWTGKDPSRFDGGTNLYTYVGNSPLDWIDPTGLFGEPLPAFNRPAAGPQHHGDPLEALRDPAKPQPDICPRDGDPLIAW